MQYIVFTLFFFTLQTSVKYAASVVDQGFFQKQKQKKQVQFYFKITNTDSK